MILLLLKQKKKNSLLKCSYDEEQSVFCKDFFFTPSLNIFNHVVFVEKMCFDKMCFINHSAFLKKYHSKECTEGCLVYMSFIKIVSVIHV